MENKLIAFTFDDGPSVTTPSVLDILEKYNVTGTFFLVGENINDQTAEIVKRAFSIGCEIENHSYSHSDMSKMSNDEISREIDLTSRKIFDITGTAPRFFRPPYIALSDNLYEQVKLTFICGKGVDDWDERVSVSQRIDGILSFAEDGVIALLHDMEGNDATVKTLEEVIPVLLDRGFELVTVSQLFERKRIEPNVNEKIIYSIVN